MEKRVNKLPKLPVGIQSFEKLREDDFLYVDKTQAIFNLLQSAGYFFLSRPRRFGKSLTLSTIKAIYEGKQELFKDLWIEDQWDWSQTRPVIHFSFSKMDYQDSGLTEAIKQTLHFQAELHQITLESTTIKNLFSELLNKLAQQQGKVVLLIDEYDKPLIDYLDDIPTAKANQKTLKTFYSVLKDSDPELEFVLLTGISKFSKVSVFSDLNNLFDLTFAPQAATLTGYTQAELEHYFAPYLPAAMKALELSKPDLLDKLQEWYNGYSWDTRHHVYNPFAILNFFSFNDFRNFWFESGTPTFLPQLMKAQQVFEIDDIELDELAFSSYSIEKLQVIPILFQTGYLTLKSREEYGFYRLGYPNREVRASMMAYLIGEMRHAEPALSTPTVVYLHKAFLANDVEQVIELIKTIFKNIPSQIFIKEAESYYHSLIYLVFYYLGQYSESEVNTNNGRLDCVVKTPERIYVIEFKLNKTAAAALQQIKDKSYAEKYRADPREKVMLGINFSSESKSVEGWEMEVLV